MEAIITHDERIFLEYNLESKTYEISHDDGRSYPYELYEDIALCGRDFYLIYLEDLDMIPSSTYDKWLSLDEAISHLNHPLYKDKDATKAYLDVLLDLKNKDIL